MIAWIFFFFQAEDGIRDLVRSRGLGDVYKRQGLNARLHPDQIFDLRRQKPVEIADEVEGNAVADAVSYTHLTLPTSDLV